MKKRINKYVQTEIWLRVSTPSRGSTSQRQLTQTAFQTVQGDWLQSRLAANAEIKFYVFELDGLGVVAAATPSVLNQRQGCFENTLFFEYQQSGEQQWTN